MSPCWVTSPTHIIYDIVTKLQLQYYSSSQQQPIGGQYCCHWPIRGQDIQMAAASESQALVTGIGCQQKKTMQCFAFNTVTIGVLMCFFTHNLASIYHGLAMDNELYFGQGSTYKHTDLKLYKYWYIDTSVVMAWGWPLSVYWCHWSGKHCGCDSLTVTSIKKVKLLQVM